MIVHGRLHGCSIYHFLDPVKKTKRTSFIEFLHEKNLGRKRYQCGETAWPNESKLGRKHPWADLYKDC
jgi:hypothetical protein